jgi:hypothetical protein
MYFPFLVGGCIFIVVPHEFWIVNVHQDMLNIVPRIGDGDSGVSDNKWFVSEALLSTFNEENDFLLLGNLELCEWHIETEEVVKEVAHKAEADFFGEGEVEEHGEVKFWGQTEKRHSGMRSE